MELCNNLSSSAPQGSGIGPVALIIFINGLAMLLEAYKIKCKIFADDVNIYMSTQNANCAVGYAKYTKLDQ